MATFSGFIGLLPSTAGTADNFDAMNDPASERIWLMVNFCSSFLKVSKESGITTIVAVGDHL